MVNTESSYAEELRILQEYLQELDRDELEKVAKDASVPFAKRDAKRHLLLRPGRVTSQLVGSVASPSQTEDATMNLLLRPEHVEAVKKVVRAANLRPKGAGRKPFAIDEEQGRAEQAAVASGVSLQKLDRIQEMHRDATYSTEVSHTASLLTLRICNVHEPLQPSEAPEKRKSLHEVKVGDKLSGRVVEISLLDGIRIDLGFEVDALEERDPEPQNLTFRLSKKRHALFGALARRHVQRNQCCPKLLRLAPLVWADWMFEGHAIRMWDVKSETKPAVLDGPMQDLEDDLPDWQIAGKALRPASDLPHRPPPEVVMSIGPEKLEAIQANIPSLTIRYVTIVTGDSVGAKPKPAARKAWTRFLNDEVASLRLQLSCRRRLARELAAIEAQLLQGHPPAVPVELLGMTMLPSGEGCLLPVPAGDCLKFQVKEFDSAEDMHEWIESCHSHHRAEWSLNRSQAQRDATAVVSPVTSPTRALAELVTMVTELE
eukprot:Skav207273  [mRNA]  locus=scaffold434:61697:70032:- [translate_table: standard]